MADRRSIILGILFGMSAGALWGLVFLAPELVRGFGPLHLTAGRYVAYGSIALLLILPRWRRLSEHLGRGEWLHLSGLALLGNTLYYILLASAVQLGGVAITSLVIGFLPVTVTLIGSRSRDAVPLSRLFPSLLFSALGISVIGAEAVSQAMRETSWTSLGGLACAFGALISWTVFAVGNSRALSRLTQVSAHDWSLLLGIATGLQGLLLIPLARLLESTGQSGSAWVTFLLVSGGVGLFASVIGNALWNRMSQLLPLTLVGQMILFETLFALLYGFLWERRLPTAMEIAAMGCVLAGVVSCLSAHTPRRIAP